MVKHTWHQKLFETADGFSTDRWRRAYIDSEISKGLLPKEAHRMAHIVSMEASPDPAHRIFFWQLHSILGRKKVQAIVTEFYQRVYNDDEEPWFKQAFTRISGIDHHIATQSQMWIDAFGGGKMYHGGEYRLNFHHQHNAGQVMNAQGAARWYEHMMHVLDDPKMVQHMEPDPERVRRTIGDFLNFFMGKYGKDFSFKSKELDFNATLAKQPGPEREAAQLFVPLTEAAVAELSVSELRHGLKADGVDLTGCVEKSDLVDKALLLRAEQLAQRKEAQTAAAVQQPLGLFTSLSEQAVQSMGVSELKQSLKAEGANITGCVEKSDLVQKALQLREEQLKSGAVQPMEVDSGADEAPETATAS